MVLEIFSSFKNFSPIKPITLDDWFDQMNRSMMFMFCIIAGTIISFKQYSGSLILCHGFESLYTAEFSDEYCWTSGLYTYKELYNLSWPDVVPYPGILPVEKGMISPGSICTDAQGQVIECQSHLLKPLTKIHHVWYQFVPFYLWSASLMFFLPYTFYKHLGGMSDLKPILEMLHNPVETEEEIKGRIDNCARWLYIKLDSYMNHTAWYTQIIQKHSMFFIILMTKVFYLIASVAVFWTTDQMFQLGSYSTYGYDWIVSLYPGTSHIIMDKLFPKMVACEIQQWGTTGLDVENGMCVIAPNVINSYLFLIFWLMNLITIITNVFSIIVTLFKLCFINVGYRKLMRDNFLKDNKRYRRVYNNVGTTGRFILQTVASNINARLFEDLLDVLSSILVDKFNKRIASKEGRTAV